MSIVVSFGLGIAFDHSFQLSRIAFWCIAISATALLISKIGMAREPRVILLLASWASLGALSHRATWSDREPTSITQYLNDERQLVKLSGFVCSTPEIEENRDRGRSAAWKLEDRSRALVSLTSLFDEESRSVDVSGRAQLSVAGALSHVQIGDQIEAVCWLSKPERPRNPGGFDSSTYLREHYVDALLFADHPTAVKHISSPSFELRRTIAQIRAYLSKKFDSHLSFENAAIGSAMILGDRSAIPIAIHDAYRESGALHILAISGLHVAILAALMSYAARVLNVPSTVTAIGIAVTIWAYAALTNFSPSVVRATIFVSLWSFATIVLRQTSLLNITAVTALTLLTFDPLMLFDIGAQLSFLAVVGISWSLWFFPQSHMWQDALGELSWSSKWIKSALSIQILGVGIWLFIAPVTAAHFGIASPIGILLNVLLIPLSTAVMWCGYLFFGSCLVLPFSAGLFATVFDVGLTAMNSLVLAAAHLPYGHFSVASPPNWWLLGYYPLLAISLVHPRFAERRVRSASVLLLWAIVGVGVSGAMPAEHFTGLRMTALDVGHGGAILIESPSGRTMLFDCGSMQDDRHGAESVWRCLRTRGYSSLDVLVISHADLDHCNNVPALLKGGQVGSVIVNRSFLKLDQPIVKNACDASLSAETPIRLVNAGDSIQLDQNLKIQVLHPRDRPPGEDDNANSLVMRVEYAGRSILLTGDIEGSGFEEMRRQVRGRSHDIVVAPHHGGLLANTLAFARWAKPRTVVVSCSDAVNIVAMYEIYSSAEEILFNSLDGAISVEISPDGKITAEGYLSRL